MRVSKLSAFNYIFIITLVMALMIFLIMKSALSDSNKTASDRTDQTFPDISSQITGDFLFWTSPREAHVTNRASTVSSTEFVQNGPPDEVIPVIPLQPRGSSENTSAVYALIDGKVFNITDASLTASSSYTSRRRASSSKPGFPYCSRLREKWYRNCYRFAWLAETLGAHKNTWIQARLTRYWDIVKIATQGRKSEYSQWVTRYRLASVRYRGTIINWYPSNDNYTVFEGNTKIDDVVTHDLGPPLRARVVRLHVLGYINAVALSWELFGKVPTNDDS